jgi:tetratricopeptide (TPR) repeat protein
MKESVFKRLWLLAAVAVAFCMATINSAVAQENPAIKQARQLQWNDQPSKAISVLNDAIKAAPTDASLLYNLGRAQIISKVSSKESEITFQKGLDVNAKEALNLAGKGHLRMVEGNATEAKTFFDQALSATKSKNASVLRAVAEGYMANPKFVNDAITLLTKAKGIDNDPFTYILLGDAYSKLAKGGDAVSSYEKAASLDPKNGVPLYKVGVVYLRSKNYPVAEENLLKAISIDANTTLAHKELGELYYSTKKPAQAVKSYETYLSLTEFKDDAQSMVAFMYFMNKEYDKANAIFKTLIAKPNVSATTLKYNFFALVEAGKLDEAMVALDQFKAKAKPEDITADIYKYLGDAFVKGGKDSLGIVNYNIALSIDSSLVDLQRTVAEMFHKQKKFGDAAVAYKKLQKIAPKLSARDMYNFGQSYYFTSQLPQADTMFQKLAENQPNSTVPYLWLARTNAAIDSTAEKGLAKPYFEKLVEKASANPEKGKADIIEAYLYLGYYHFNKNDIPTAKSYYEKILGMNPDPRSKMIAEEALKAIREAKAPPQNKPKRAGQR